MASSYYFISDIHIGVGPNGEKTDIETQLIFFLKIIEKSPNTELIFVGDTFRLWEMDNFDGVDKIYHLIELHKDLFEQIKKVGKQIKITMIPGNHDDELAYEPKYKSIFKKYNINLEPKLHITRNIGKHKIWIEHGHQYDHICKIPNFGAKDSRPMGYYIARYIDQSINKSTKGRHPWLADMNAVDDPKKFIGWLASNYFYKELSPLIRYSLLPFLTLFSISILMLFLLGAYKLNITPIPVNILEWFNTKGIVGNLLTKIIWIDIFIIIALSLISIPVIVIFRDIIKTVRRYGLLYKNEKQKEFNNYISAAEKIFKKHKDVKLFVFGHTHRAFIQQQGEKAILNTGTWEKKIRKIKPWFGLLPRVYYPYYLLNFFKVTTQGEKICIESGKIHKTYKPKLTTLESIIVKGKKIKIKENVPEKTIY